MRNINFEKEFKQSKENQISIEGNTRLIKEITKKLKKGINPIDEIRLWMLIFNNTSKDYYDICSNHVRVIKMLGENVEVMNAILKEIVNSQTILTIKVKILSDEIKNIRKEKIKWNNK